MGNGHFYPILPLCSQLAARGFRVTCPVSDRYSRHVYAAGAEAVVFTETPVDEALRAENEERSTEPAKNSRRFDTSELEWAYFSRSTRELLAQAVPFYEKNVPDVIIYNRYCVAGRIAVHHLG